MPPFMIAFCDLLMLTLLTRGNIYLKKCSGLLFEKVMITVHRYQASLFIPTAQLDEEQWALICVTLLE